jgi:hypothetical protein
VALAVPLPEAELAVAEPVMPTVAVIVAALPAVMSVLVAELLAMNPPSLPPKVADAVAKSLQHLQHEPFAARFGFLTLLPKKFQ